MTVFFSREKKMDTYYYQNLGSVTDYKSRLASSSKPAKLVFTNDVASQVFTKEIISRRCDGNGGIESIKIMLVDSNTEEKITTGPLASAKVKIVLLRADCGDTTTGQEFQEKIVVNLGRKKNLLLGNLEVDLKHGCGTVYEIWIKHDKIPLKSARFRLGAMVVDCGGRYHEVKEAITEPFQVKDRRNMPKYSGPLSLEHEVWQLKNISKKGQIYKRLKKKGILTVGDFVSKHSSNARELQEICGMKGKKWEMTVNHAKASRIENANGSTSQQSNTLAYDDHDHSIELCNDCYKPHPCVETGTLSENMMIDDTFSISAYVLDGFEPLQAYQGEANGALEGGICTIVKKRWTKLRMFGCLSRRRLSHMCPCGRCDL